MDALILDMGDGVRGECRLPGFEGKIELLSFSHGVAMQITGDIAEVGRTSGNPRHRDMTVTKYLDMASPLLNQACCEGKDFPQVEVIIARADHGQPRELMRYTMKNVIISSISIGGGGGDKPVETVSLNYNQISWSFTHDRTDEGKAKTIDAEWDLTKN